MRCRKLLREVVRTARLAKWRRKLLVLGGVIFVSLAIWLYEEAVTTKKFHNTGPDKPISYRRTWKEAVERKPALSNAEVARRFDEGIPIKRRREKHKHGNPDARHLRPIDKPVRTYAFERDRKLRYQQRKEEFCGPAKWKEQYKKLHRETLLAVRPQRFLVYHCGGEGYGCGGYGNRLSAIASLFYLAVLTNRAFLIDWNYKPIAIQQYFRPKNIYWNFTLENSSRLSSRSHFWGAGYPTKVTLNVSHPFPGEPDKFWEWLESTDLVRYFNYSVEKVTSMWYISNGIWRNSYLADRMKQLVTKERGSKFSLVGCAIDFLFHRTPRLEDLLIKARTSTGINQNVPSIGIHIRIGDASFGRPLSRKGAVLTEDYKAFFACAKNFEKVIARTYPGIPQDEVKWFVASDNRSVKEYALREFKEKVVVLDNRIEHIALVRKKRKIPSDEGMIGLLLDHFILSECDFLVVSKSSFSYTALGLTFHRHGEYSNGEKCSIR